MLRSTVICAALLSLAACPGPANTGVQRNNTAPRASLRAPVIAPVGSEVTFDASDSFDADGDPLTFIFEINGVEAVESADPEVRYTFESDGLYSVLVRAIDLHGADGTAVQDVAARLEYPEEPDFCQVANDCVVGDECLDGVCWSSGGSLE